MRTATIVCLISALYAVSSLPASYSSSMGDPLLSSLGLGSMGMSNPMGGMYGGIPPPMPPPGMSPYGMSGMNGMGYGMMGPFGGSGMYGPGMSPYGMNSMGGLGSQMSFPFMGKK